MQNLLEEYKAYYKIRLQRFEGNPRYKHSFEAEKQLNDLVQSCSDLSEIKDQIKELSEKCAVAAIKDEYIMEQQKFEEFKEDIRILSSKRILSQADNFDKVLDLTSMVVEEENKNSIEISMDEANRELINAWNILDNIIVYENAEVPEKYRSDMQETVKTFKNNLKEQVQSLEENNQAWEAGWRLNPDIVTEYRHRRLLPYSDEHIQEQLQKYKAIVER